MTSTNMLIANTIESGISMTQISRISNVTMRQSFVGVCVCVCVCVCGHRWGVIPEWSMTLRSECCLYEGIHIRRCPQNVLRSIGNN